MVSHHKELLNIFLITYNRDSHLDYTLGQIVGCPFTKFPITILDNCSTDSTYDVYLKYQYKIPTLNYIKNKINIGADANVLRGVELSEGEYTWILCDDDVYDFTNCNEVLEELQKSRADAIMVGSPQMCAWPNENLYDTPANLIKNNYAYFVIPSFLPGGIFKTKLFQDQIAQSYTNIVNLYPAMTYYIKLYNENRPIYVAKNKIVNAAARAGYYASFLNVIGGLVNTFYLVNSVKIRQKAFYEIFPDLSYKTLVDHALIMRHPTNTMPSYTIFRYFNLLKWYHKLVFFTAYIGNPIIRNLTSNYRALYKSSFKL